MTYLEELRSRYKEARKRMQRHAIKEKLLAINSLPPTPKPEPELKPEVTKNLPKAGLVSEKAEKEIICKALKVTSLDNLEHHSQAYKMANELVNSPRLPPLPGLVLDEIGAVRWMRIMHAVAKMHGIPASDIMGKSRENHIVSARFEIFYRLRIDLAMSYAKIGSIFGKDHTTVIHGVRKVRQKLLDEIKRQADDDCPLVANHSVHGGPHTPDLSAA